MLWGFLGIESACVCTGVVKNPKRTVPIATILGLIVASICYVGSTVAIMGIVPHEVLLKSTAPFAEAARYMFGFYAGEIVSAIAAIATLGSLPGWLILQSEVPKAAAHKGLFPKFFGKTTKRNVPLLNLIFTATIMSLVLLLTASPVLVKQITL